MDKDFITQGIQADRYLEADKLVTEFRAQIRSELETVCRDILEEARNSNLDLFEGSPDLDYTEFGVDSRTLTTIRVEFDMVPEHEEHGTLKLNVGFEWVDSEAQAPDCIDSEMETEIRSSNDSLCYVYYKIQRDTKEVFDAVKSRTRKGDQPPNVCFGEDQWPYRSKEAPGIVFVPVESGDDIVAGLERLQQHFFEHYAPELGK